MSDQSGGLQMAKAGDEYTLSMVQSQRLLAFPNHSTEETGEDLSRQKRRRVPTKRITGLA